MKWRIDESVTGQMLIQMSYFLDTTHFVLEGGYCINCWDRSINHVISSSHAAVHITMPSSYTEFNFLPNQCCRIQFSQCPMHEEVKTRRVPFRQKNDRRSNQITGRKRRLYAFFEDQVSLQLSSVYLPSISMTTAHITFISCPP